jgi:hypothetical protein
MTSSYSLRLGAQVIGIAIVSSVMFTIRERPATQIWGSLSILLLLCSLIATIWNERRKAKHSTDPLR